MEYSVRISYSEDLKADSDESAGADRVASCSLSLQGEKAELVVKREELPSFEAVMGTPVRQDKGDRAPRQPDSLKA